MQDRGLKTQREYKIDTPNGEKSSRYVDVVGKDANGNVVEMHQIGKQTKAGEPVAREKRALDDVQNQTGQRPIFDPYNKPRWWTEGTIIMGRQFQVYLLPADAARILDLVRQKTGVRLISSRSLGSEPAEIESPVQSELGVSRVDCLLVPDLSVPIKLDHLEKQDNWVINTLHSEVVEFSGCHFDGKTLKKGRFFYDAGFYDADQWQEKSPRFLDWAEGLFRAVKKSLKRAPSLDAYVGEDAELWRSRGGGFVSLAIKGQPPIIAK
jgi:hypothetical protein